MVARAVEQTKVFEAAAQFAQMTEQRHGLVVFGRVVLFFLPAVRRGRRGGGRRGRQRRFAASCPGGRGRCGSIPVPFPCHGARLGAGIFGRQGQLLLVVISGGQIGCGRQNVRGGPGILPGNRRFRHDRGFRHHFGTRLVHQKFLYGLKPPPSGENSLLTTRRSR